MASSLIDIQTRMRGDLSGSASLFGADDSLGLGLGFGKGIGLGNGAAGFAPSAGFAPAAEGDADRAAPEEACREVATGPLGAAAAAEGLDGAAEGLDGASARGAFSRWASGDEANIGWGVDAPDPETGLITRSERRGILDASRYVLSDYLLDDSWPSRPPGPPPTSALLISRRLSLLRMGSASVEVDLSADGCCFASESEGSVDAEG